MPMNVDTALALTNAYIQLYPEEEPTTEKIESFLYECARVGAETLCICKEMTEQKQN